MKTRILLILCFALLLCRSLSAQSTDNTLSVKNFKGSDVAAKLASAMLACDPSISCILVLDPSLAAWAQGTLPTLCPKCSLLDYRNGVVSGGGALPSGVTSDGANGIAVSGIVAAGASVSAPQYCIGANCVTSWYGATLSGISYTKTDTTIAATWTSSVAGDSTMRCSGIKGADDGAQSSVTSHQAIVAGLLPLSPYKCYVSTNGTNSAPSIVTTNSPLLRYPIISASLGTITQTSLAADTFFNFQDASGTNYMLVDDSTSAPSCNFCLFTITNPATMATALVNSMSAYGASQSLTGTDGAGAAPMAYKENGLFGLNGQKIAFTSRNTYVQPQPQWYGNLISDHSDNGATWNNHQNPSSYSATGSPDGSGISMFSDTVNAASCSPVRYAPDDGTMGYNTAGNGIDGANAYVYTVCSNGFWDNASFLYMRRTPRAWIVQLTAEPQWEWWTGPTSPTPLDFVNPGNWSHSGTGKVAIYSAASQTGWSNISFIAGFNYYSLETWYYTLIPGGTVWNFYAGPTPAGPWTLYYTAPWNAGTCSSCGYYNPVPLHSQVASVNHNGTATYNLLWSGNYTVPANYKLSYAPLTITGNIGGNFVGGGAEAVGSPFSTITYPANSASGPKLNVVAGNDVIAIVAVDGITTVNTISDLAGCTWTAKGTPQAMTTGAAGAFFYTYLGTACGSNAQDVITVTLNSTSVQYSVILAWQLTMDGVDVVFDTQAHGTSTAATTVSTPTFNTAYAKEVVVGACVTSTLMNTTASGAIAGFTLDTPTIPAGGYLSAVHQSFATTQTGITAGCTFGAAHNLEVFAVAFGHN